MPLRASLVEQETEPEQGVLSPLDEGNRHALADLPVVAKSEPLVGEVAAAVDHELRAENAAQCPSCDQRGHHGVGESSNRGIGPPTTLEVDRHRDRQSDATETREAALPDCDPSSEVTRVVAPVGGDIGDSSADQTGDDDRAGEFGEGGEVEPGALEAASE